MANVLRCQQDEKYKSGHFDSFWTLFSPHGIITSLMCEHLSSKSVVIDDRSFP